MLRASIDSIKYIFVPTATLIESNSNVNWRVEDNKLYVQETA